MFSLLIIIICLVLEIVLYSASLWYEALDIATGMWQVVGARILYIYLCIIGIPCIIISTVSLLRKSRNRNIALMAIILSIAMMIPPPLSPLYRIIGSALAPLAHEKYSLRLEQQKEDFYATKDRHASELNDFFKGKKRIIAVGGPYMLLEDKKEVRLLGVNQYARQPEFERFVEENIVRNKIEVEMRLPDYLDFVKEYNPGAHSGYFSRLCDHKYGAIPILVYIDGRLLNLDYAFESSLTTLNKYQQNFK